MDNGRGYRNRKSCGVSNAGRPWGKGVAEKLVWHVVKEFAVKDWSQQTRTARPSQ
jgi:hypothetical protein